MKRIDVPISALYIRVPRSLHRQLKQAAKAANQSLNTYLVDIINEELDGRLTQRGRANARSRLVAPENQPVDR